MWDQEFCKSLFFIFQEEKDVIEITIVRRGAALVAREIEYYIEPDGEEEFYGSLNVIKFKPGEVMKKINVIARKDGIPEVWHIQINVSCPLFTTSDKTD